MVLRPGAGLEFALHPHHGACRWAGVYVALALLYAMELIRIGRPVAGLFGVGCALWAAVVWRRLLCPTGPGAPRRLLVLESGQTLLFYANGAQELVQLRSSSVQFGQFLLLVLDGRRRHRLLLGPANVSHSSLAALRRRLRGAGLIGARVE